MTVMELIAFAEKVGRGWHVSVGLTGASVRIGDEPFFHASTVEGAADLAVTAFKLAPEVPQQKDGE